MTVRVLLIDVRAMVRAGFRLILESEEGIAVAGEAEDGLKAIATAQSARPDVVLMDVQMPAMDGLEATRRIVAAAVDGRSRVLILTTFERDEYIFEALRAGAGDALLAPSVTRRIIAEFARRPPAVPRPLDLTHLTEREIEVLRLVARGLTNAEIADALSVGEATVKTHVSNVLAKLDLRDRVQAVVLAYETGLVVPGGP
jgi:DNA-binding NarL/FixJ family response regulator